MNVFLPRITRIDRQRRPKLRLRARLKIVGADVRRLFALVGSEEKSKPPDVGSYNEKHFKVRSKPAVDGDLQLVRYRRIDAPGSWARFILWNIHPDF